MDELCDRHFILEIKVLSELIMMLELDEYRITIE